MKFKLNYGKTIFLTMVAFFILFSYLELPAKIKSTEFQSFKIIVENTEKGIRMESQQGSAWLDLSFSLKPYKPQAVDEYGMTTLNKSKQSSVIEYLEEDIANFLFTITKTNEGIELKGIEGTAWIDLTFTLAENQKQAFDEYGMTSLD